MTPAFSEPVAHLGGVCLRVCVRATPHFPEEKLQWFTQCTPQIHLHLEPQNVTLSGDRVFVDIISEGS